uniref:PHD-type domain-containing protein n=1 Tax=Fagus sylvatica TaxID=28930 RepID=A0A2N9IQA2_FAGSY
MELNNNSNDDDTHAKLDEPSRAMPFEIDLNEPPLSSPRDSLPAAELSPPPSRHRVALLDINAAPPSEAEPDHCVESVNSGVRHIVRTDFKDSVQQRLNFTGNFTETDLGSDLKGRLWGSDTTPHKIPFQNPSEVSLGIGTEVTQACTLKDNSRTTQTTSEDNEGYGVSQLQDGLPIQFEDFCILSVGEVDPRPSYHNPCQIWPIGYRSSWHDRITGSLFVCDVSDGGDSGPVFKVQRFSCSTQPIPIGSTVISRPGFGLHDAKGKEESDDPTAFVIIDDEDTNIQMILFDRSPPQLDHNMLSGSGNNSNEVCDFQTMNILQTESNCFPQSHRKCTVENSGVIDNIGEFLVEGRSSVLVWKMVSQTLADACHNVYKQTGLCKFCCKDADPGMWSSCLVTESTKTYDPLDKFCYISGPINIPCCIQSDDELITTCGALVKWLEQDRFGLDTEFVQEVIEQLPGVHACSEYKFLNERCDISKSQTVGSGFLLGKRKTDLQSEKEADGSLRGCKRSRKQVFEESAMKDCCPPGKPVSLKLPADSIGDVLQSWELLCRFSDVLGLEEPLSFKELEGELLNGYSFITRRTLTKVHCSLLKVLLGELQAKVAAFVDPNSDVLGSKFRRGRKKDTDYLISVKKTMFDLLPVDELTWLELARRYILTVSFMHGNLDSMEILGHESCKVLQCLRGDGGLLCGSNVGVAGREADKLLLAEATKQIFGSAYSENNGLSVEHNKSDAIGGCKTVKVNNGETPEWAQALEPVRKLPTNVGARIRNCVYTALEKDPPEWAKKLLEHSISKEVYKGNASGPTKKAVISILAEVCGEDLQQKPNRKRKDKCVNTVSDVIMKQCRNVLHLAAAADKKMVFASLLGGSLNTSDNDDEGLLESPSMLSRPLDFRIIDMKLTSGAYGGSHEAFLEDVREVLNFVPKLVDNETGGCSSAEAKKKTGDISECAKEMPKAPSDEGVCKLCGVNKDDENVLLCDMCDSGYHTYCLNPPVVKIPDGNWYCPSCVTGHGISQGSSQSTEVKFRKKRCQRDFNHRLPRALAHLATTMEMKEYWEYTVEERIFLLKFLCDEVLNSTKIREHLEQCASMSADLQQKLHSLSSEWRHLKFREEVAAAQVVKVNPNMRNGIGKSVTEEVAIVHTSYHKLMGQLLSRSSCMSPFSTNINPLGDRFGWPVPNDSSKQPCWLYSKGSSENHSTSSGSQIVKMHDVESQKNQLSFGKNGLKSENPLCRMVPSCARESYSRQNMLPLFIPQQQKDKSSGENVTWSNYEGKQDLENGSIDGSMVPYGEFLRGHLSSDTIRTHVAEHVHALHMNNGNLFPSCHSIIQPAVKESQAKNLKASFLKKEIDVLQDSIASLESQLLKVSLRKDFLGRDSAGRLYWGFSWPGTPPWVVIDGTMIVLQKKIEKQGTSYMCMRNDDTTFPWISFQSDTEIEELIQWLRDTYPLERELLDAILQWQNITCKDSNKAIDCVQDEGPPTMSRPVNGAEVVNSNCLAIRALVVLEKKFGACLKSESVIPIKQSQKAEVNFTEQMCRCDCLELIWPSRCHCYSCHQSFSTSEELKRHDNGMCYPSVPTSVNKVNGNALKGKEMMRTETSLGECSNEIGIGRVSGSAVHEVGVELNKIPKELACPFDIEEISTKFITKDSNKELVQGIGLIGSNGVPSFVPSTSSYLDDPTLKLEPSWKNEGKQGGSKKMKISERQGKFSINSTRRFAKNGIYVEALKLEGSMKDRVQSSLLKCKTSDLRFGNGSIICESSSRPIIGREVQLLRQLKMNLLDMDSALPEEALKPSRAGLDKRRAWCAFVKSAKSILEMVQATIVLEDMIKTEYLRSGWQYWSSLCAAARIATISSLALRICTLDAALVYEKPLPSSSSTEIENLGSESDINILTCSNPINTPKTGCNPVQKTCGVVLTDNANPSSKRSKRRKDSGG